MKAYRGEVKLHSFLTSALNGDEWFNFTPRPENEPRYPLNKGLGGQPEPVLTF